MLGTGLFVDDITLPGMIYAKALRSKYPRARVEKIDLTRALAHPDVVRILTAKDVPFNKTGHIIQDWDVLIAEGDCTRYVATPSCWWPPITRRRWTRCSAWWT